MAGNLHSLLTFCPDYDWAVIEMRDFKRIVFDVIQAVKGRVLESTFTSPHIGRNYFSVGVILGDSRNQILASSQFPVFAFVSEEAHSEFVEWPILMTAFSCVYPRFKVMSLRELQTRTVGLSLDGLRSDLQSDIEDWCPCIAF